MDEGDGVGHAKGSGGVPAGAIKDQDSMLITGQRLGEFVQEALHDRGGHGRHDQGEGIPGDGVDGGEQIGPVEALVTPPGWALPFRPPPMAQAALLADAGFVLEEQADPLAWMIPGGGLQDIAQVFFLNRC